MHNTPHSEESKRKMSVARKGFPLLKKRRPFKKINGVELWRCGTCRDFFPKDGFYKNKRTVLGITHQCRKCHMETAMRTRNYKRHCDYRRSHARILRKKFPEKYRDKDRLASRKRVRNYKSIARAILNYAVKIGKIIRPEICSECLKKKKTTGHHSDYLMPLKVDWLCYECHGLRHRKNKVSP
jgi:hypothetical protein